LGSVRRAAAFDPPNGAGIAAFPSFQAIAPDGLRQPLRRAQGHRTDLFEVVGIIAPEPAALAKKLHISHKVPATRRGGSDDDARFDFHYVVWSGFLLGGVGPGN
jgi:hypothetical protein